MTPVNGRGGSRAFPIENRSNPSPEWNHYRIECVDGEISLAVNGKVVTRGEDCIPRKGYICLESEGGIVHYRNVRIRELPSCESYPGTGGDFRSGLSYRSTPDWARWLERSGRGKMEPNDWVLSFQGDTDQAGQLTSNESVSRSVFVVDVRLKDASSGTRIEAGPGISLDLLAQPPASPFSPLAAGTESRSGVARSWRWKSMAHVLGSISRVHSGRSGKAADLTLRPVGTVDFCNLYVRSTDQAAAPGRVR